ncbi:MAG TPA: DNA polymerase/3'-5' exonuclease PolX [Chloroflexi bacterium]|nr:DNA polymerase/3'-5' exonuclease PolX [Chloroflexota bacterium]
MARLSNQEIASIFSTIADMLEIKGENIHRVLAYRRAAETIAELPRDIHAVYEEGKLTELPHIGETLAAKIEELLTTGELGLFNRLADEIPPGVVEMLRIPGVGPKRAARFWKELGITSVEELKEAALAGKLRTLPGMGAKSEARILEGIEALARRSDRISIGVAYPTAMRLLDALLKVEGSLKGDVAGSLRRGCATIGDLDLLIASHEAEPIMEAFVELPDVARVLVQGPTKTSVELYNGLQVDLRVLPPERYGTSLVYFTGSKAHNVRLRELALKQGLSLSENSFIRLDDESEILCATEEEVYATLGLPWIAPELREDRGEIEAALAGELPDLITLEDIRGDLQLHTRWSDGQASVLEMAKAALARGYRYILVTDHSYGLGVVQGLAPEDIPRQREEIEAANAELGGAITILHGVEVEIKADGTLDYDDETLAQFDIVQASLHTSLRQPREQITQRLLNAIQNPHVDIIGHPRGRLIPDREPADLDMDTIFEAAAKHDVALEINANPHRLDLDDVHARRAVELGIKLTISTDAHRPEDFDLMHFGVATARRGWVSARDVINAWPLEQVMAWVEGRQR